MHSRSISWFLLFVVSVSTLLAGCAPPRALIALREERVTLGITGDEAIAQAGPPELWIAKDGVESIFYKNGDQAVMIAMLDGKVVGYDDRAVWPAPAERAADDADKPVSLGKIHVGMSEAEVLQRMGKPDGYTAEGGLETMHYVSGDDADSIIELKNGVVVGYVDYEINEYSQNVPRHDRDESTTSGKVRVGMTKQQVQQLLGKPSSVSASEGQVINKYDSNAVFGNDLVYAVAYVDDVVAGFSQENITLAKEEQEEREEREAERRAAAAGEVEEDSGPSIASILFGFLLNEGVKAALGERTVFHQETSSTKVDSPAPKVTDCSCPEIKCPEMKSGIFGIVQSCRAHCVNTRAACSCTGRCNEDGSVVRDHDCHCR